MYVNLMLPGAYPWEWWGDGGMLPTDTERASQGLFSYGGALRASDLGCRLECSSEQGTKKPDNVNQRWAGGQWDEVGLTWTIEGVFSAWC